MALEAAEKGGPRSESRGPSRARALMGVEGTGAPAEDGATTVTAVEGTPPAEAVVGQSPDARKPARGGLTQARGTVAELRRCRDTD